MKRAGPEPITTIRPRQGPVGRRSVGALPHHPHGTQAAGGRRRAARRCAFTKEIMTKKMLIDATHAEETRVVVVDGTRVDEFDFESLNKRQLAGNIYLAKVTRVEPSLQAAFVDYGGNRHGFLAFSEIHPDYYQIPKADREALIAEEAALAREAEEEATREKPKPRGRSAQPPPAAGRRRGRAGRRGRGRRRAGRPRSTPVEAEALDDVPPPSAAAGDIDIVVPEEPDAADGRRADDEHDHEHELRGGRRRRRRRGARRRASRLRQRRYKIQEVIKVRQILLVQVVKEERGNKGAALTTYLSLAGRYCVLMPNTARGGGICRKITNAADRKKLKEISSSITVPDGAGLIIRTAGAAAPRPRSSATTSTCCGSGSMIRDLTLKSIAPCADLRGRQPDQAGDPRPLQPRHGRDPRRRRARLPRGQGLHEDAHAFAREEREALRRPPAALLALPGRELPLGDVQPDGAAQVRRLHRHRRHRGAGRDRRELGPRDPRGLDRGDRAQDQHGGGRGGGAADAAARPRRPHRHRLHRHGGPAQQRRRGEEAQGQAEDRPGAHPGRADLGLRPAGDEPAAAAARHDRGDDQGLPALPRHRPGALGRLDGAGAPARDRGGRRQAALEGGADRRARSRSPTTCSTRSASISR